jgi:hypothetical protein
MSKLEVMGGMALNWHYAVLNDSVYKYVILVARISSE